jgi:hypothetical protein
MESLLLSELYRCIISLGCYRGDAALNVLNVTYLIDEC